jgi:hypothetical protein
LHKHKLRKLPKIKGYLKKSEPEKNRRGLARRSFYLRMKKYHQERNWYGDKEQPQQCPKTQIKNDSPR